MRYIVCLIFLFLQYSAFSKVNLCKEKQQPISLGFYTIGFLFYEEEGEFLGIDKDVVEQLEKRTNCKFHSTVMTRARIWKELETGELDMSVSGIPTPERMKFAHFVRYFTARQFLITTNQFANYSNIQEFVNDPNIKFAKVRSFKHGAFFDAMFDSIKDQERLIDVTKVDDLFDLISKDKVQVIVAMNVVYPYWLQKLNLKNKVAIKDFKDNTETIPGDLILSKKKFSKEQADMFKKVISQQISDGTLLKLFSAYVGLPIAKSILPK